MTGRSERGPGEPGGDPAPADVTAFDRAALAALPAAARPAALAADLRRRAAAVLQLPAAALDPDRPLAALGLDSLAALELGHALAADFGVELPLAALLEGATLADIAAAVLAARGEVPAAATVPEPAPAVPSSLLAETLEPGRPSFGQRALWFLDRLAPGGRAYVLAGAARVEGLDPGLLRRCLAALARRHPALATTFVEQGGEPVLRLHPEAVPGVAEVDASAWPPGEAAERLADLAERPFDLERDLPLRLAVVRDAPCEDEARADLLVLAVHHTAADFWSLGVLLADLAALHAGGGAAPLPPLRATWADHVRREAALAAGEQGERLWAFWRDALAGWPLVLDLPADRPRPRVLSDRGGARALRLEPATAARLAAAARRQGATPFMAVAAAFGALLARWSGQRRVLLGVPTAGRKGADFAGVVGYFTNPVPLALDLGGDPKGDELLARTRRAALAAFSHAALPFPLLAERLQPERDPARTPVFQVMLTFPGERRTGGDRGTLGEGLAALALGEPGAPFDVGGLRLQPVALARRSTPFDLSLTCAERAGGLGATLQFAADLFDPATAARLLSHFEALLSRLAAEAPGAVAEWSLLAPAERRQLLAEWNDTAAPLPAASVPEGIAEQAARTPRAVAVAQAGRGLGFAELDDRAARLARRLRALGVAPETPVGVCLERRPELLVALLAVWRAGAAYVPLDPDYPAERLALMVADSGMPLVLTDAGTAARWREVAGLAGGAEKHQVGRNDGSRSGGEGSGTAVLRAVDLDTLEADPAAPEAALPPFPVPEQLAYVLYTSGSTGRPKGVEVTHGALANFLASMGGAPGLVASDVLLAVTSLSFDIAGLELFLPLLCGARLELVPREEVRDGVLLRARLAASGATVLQTTPSTWRLLLAAGWPGAAGGEGVRVLCGGEALPPGLAAELAARSPEVWNLYGPTETTIWSTAARVLPGLAPDLGRPVANTRAVVLDPAGGLAPAGVPGELLLGGAGLARGYRGRPDLTAERFVPDPFDASGERLYRTGDLVRWRPDGTLEYLGRLDHQVKVRGVRMELGEIEAALARHPAVSAVAVLAPEEGRTGGHRLVAYAATGVPAGERRRLAVELREAARAALPEAMVPAAFVLLQALPLTPNGKVDRRALSLILPGAEEGTTGGTAPRTPTEELLAGIWCQVLGVERVAVEDDFFGLGGHSLLAAQVLARLRGALGVELPLRRLFEAPTLGALAAEVAAASPAARAADAAPIPVRPAAERRALSFAQERLWFLDQLDPGNASYNIPAAVRLTGALDLPALAGSLGEILRRHEALRTTFARGEDGRPVQVVAPPGPAVLPLVDLAGLPAGRREPAARRLAAEEAPRPFDLRSGPLLRTTLLRLDPAGREHAVLLSLHHAVADGWSLGVFVHELAALYPAARRGLPSPLAEPPLQYGDFAAWQRERLSGELLDAQLAYWRGRLAGVPLVLDLPTDRPRPPVRGRLCGRRWIALPEELSQDLRRLSREQGVTLFMTLLAGIHTLLARLTGQPGLLVGSVVAGRNRPETEALVGLFANTLVLRGDLEPEASFADLLPRARATVLEAHAHQDLPFEKLVEELQPERSLAHTPLFQVMFALQNAPFGTPRLPELEFETIELESGIAKFDLTFSLESDGPAITGWMEFADALFDPPTAARLIAGWECLLAAAAADPSSPAAGLPLLGPGERQQVLVEWNDTARGGLPEVTLADLFAAQAAATPEAVAVVAGEVRWTYRELEEHASRIARRLAGFELGRGDFVGVCLHRRAELVAALLGVVRAGAAYVPLEPAWPLDRRAWILEALGVRCLLTDDALRRDAFELQGRVPGLAHAVCLDAGGAELAPEPVDTATVRQLWDHLAERAVDRVSAGGFVSSYDGRPFSEAEVDAYVAHVADLARPYLGPDARVLEIGCGAGLLAPVLAAGAARYLGLDPSPAALAHARATGAVAGLEEAEWREGFAHELDGLEPGSFDLVAIASTAQFFPGPVYFERVVRAAFERVAPGGALLLADLLDARRKEEFRASLEEHRRAHGTGLRTKTDREGELWVPGDLVADLGRACPGAAGVRVLPRTSFANELRFRFDVLVEKAAEAAETGEAPRPRTRGLWAGGAPVSDAMPEALRGPAGPDDLAYVIFTSGSTGRPKGVVVRHRPVVNLIQWITDTCGVGPDDRVLFVTSPCFDLSVYDVFGLLAVGGSIHVVPEDELRDPQALVRRLVTEPVTFWDSAPAALQQLVGSFPPPPPGPGEAPGQERLRLVFLSGDWIPVGLPDQVRASFPNARVMALGGATEATVWSNFFPVEAVDPTWASIPYGRPIQSSRYHVLDGRLAPCPVGVPGDLYIAGLCLANGYQDAVQTADRFIPDPRSGQWEEPGGARLYRTGDRARYRPDGNLEFLGRRDHQVKIRGFRIEQGEIEAVLAAHPALREAVVAVREDTPGDRRLVAYVVPHQPTDVPDAAELRVWVREKLPEYMVPAAFVPLASLPVTANGKLDRAALPAPHAHQGEDAGAAGEEHAAPTSELERAVAAIWQDVLGVPRVGLYDNFFDLGGHSLLAAAVHARLQTLLPPGAALPMVELFRSPTVHALAAALHALQAGEPEPASAPLLATAPAPPSAAVTDGIALVGLAARFPGAPDVARFWENLCAGVESIRTFSAEELAAAGVPRRLLADPRYVRVRGVIEGADLFDAGYFGINPREAESMDPQHRVFLECAVEALEDAGCDPETCGGAIGLFAGASLSGYAAGLYADAALLDRVGLHQAVIGNDKDFVPTRVSYKLDLKGPSVAVQTACSTSLVAVHLACRSLLDGECDAALAGAVTVSVPLTAGYLYQEESILSPDGRCRAFDAGARGTVFGSGVGVVVLKRLADALAAGDSIYAVIRGSAINNDGAAKVGFTAPGVDGQAAVIAAAQARAGVAPESIGYVEAHGTGTVLGDPIEVAALTRAFRARGDRRVADACALGSVKTNVGHLDAAAGMAGLVKAALALSHRVIPPTLHYAAPNPALDLAASPFFVNAEPLGWQAAEGAPRRAGVSSFGIGGTNAHLVLEEAPALPPLEGSARTGQLLVLSARSAAALEAATDRLASHLAAHPGLALADVAFTLQAGRRRHEHRRALVCRGTADAAAALAERDPRRLLSGRSEMRERPVVFLFPGQGAQHAGMGRGLYRSEPLFREHVDRCAERLLPLLGSDLRELLDPPAGEEAAAVLRLDRTAFAQPALFVVETGLARLWESWGVRPAALLGHSVGEIAAAHLAGVLTLDDALEMVAARGALMDAAPEGAMLAVPLGEEEVVRLLSPELAPEVAVAALNGPELTVVGGPIERIGELAERLAARGVAARRLRTSHAFHSAAMDEAVQPFAERVAHLTLAAPRVPYASNLSAVGSAPTRRPTRGTGRGTCASRCASRRGCARCWPITMRCCWRSGRAPRSPRWCGGRGRRRWGGSWCRRWVRRRTKKKIQVESATGTKRLCSAPSAGCGSRGSRSTGRASTPAGPAAASTCRPTPSNGGGIG